MCLLRAASLWAAVFAMGCQSSTPVSFARPKAPSAQAMQALGGTGYTGTATFNAPVVDPNTWNGAPIGTGSYSAQSTPARSGGPQSIGAVDNSDPQQAVHYVVVGNLAGGPSEFFAVVSLNAFVAGTHPVDNSTLFAGIFDGNTGEPVALATSGTVTITSAGASVVGSFSGTLEDSQGGPPLQCRVDADCSRGEVCQAGSCVAGPPPQCTSNAQCPAGSSCQNGTCVSNPNPMCTSNSQCSSPAVCQAGRCVVPTPACRIDADCPTGQVCAAGACTSRPSALCGGEGTGAYSGSAAAPATCSALGSGAISVTQGVAAMGQDDQGQLQLMVVDPNHRATGVIIPLNACPSASGAVSVSGAEVYSEASAGSGLSLYAVRSASGTVTFSQVTSRLTGTFSLTLTSGGTLTGSFDLQ